MFSFWRVFSQTLVGLYQRSFSIQMDLEEIMSSQSIMNNEITEIEITLDNRNSRVTEAEERLSELEDRMLAINEADRAGGGGGKKE